MAEILSCCTNLRAPILGCAIVNLSLSACDEIGGTTSPMPHERMLRTPAQYAAESIALTVIIPSFNCAQWLERAVFSTMALRGGEVQVIVVDDGSTDATPEIVQALKPEFVSLVALRKTHGGLSSARNFGLAYAVGRYVLFLDADDVLVPCDISGFVSSGCHMVRIGVEEISGNGDVTYRSEPARQLSGRKYLADRFACHAFYTSSCAYLYDRRWLSRHSLAFVEGLLHEDNLFTVQALLKAETVLVTPSLLYRYIRRPESITTASDDDRLLRRVQAYVRIAGMLTDMAKEDPSFDLRWKIQEVLDGAQRLAVQRHDRKAQLTALQGLLKFMTSYRGYGRHAFRYAQLRRLLDYVLQLVKH